jgi:cellulose synthase/poly-beta-1,6-N-acetylglucosamine synthase-like glycosyltransferase
MSRNPLISIIIPCKDIDDYTRECIRYCKLLDYNNYEIILLPDGSKETIEDVKVIATGPVTPGAKRNIGVKNSRGEFCAFIDSDAFPRSDWLTNAIKYLDDPEVSGVGGPGLTPEADGMMQKAGGYVLSSFMVGALSSRYKTGSSFAVDDAHSCNFIASKAVVEASGGWNEKYWPGEDTLMCLAIKNIGKKLIASSDVVAYHHRQPLFRPHLKQISRFGEHRGFFAKKFPENSLRLIYFLPSLLLLALFAGILISLFFPFFGIIVVVSAVAYLALGLFAAASQTKRIKLVFSVWLGIIMTHVVYGVFFLLGLIRSDLKR